MLEQSGCTVLLTRSDENAIYDLDSQTLKEKKISKEVSQEIRKNIFKNLALAIFIMLYFIIIEAE